MLLTTLKILMLIVQINKNNFKKYQFYKKNFSRAPDSKDKWTVLY